MEARMTVAESLLHQHIETLVADNTRWQTLLADSVVWELPFAPALGHPARVSGRAEVVQFAAWFVGAVENFRFFDARVQAFADPEAAVAEVRGEGRIKATGRTYRQEYVVFLRASAGKIALLREYFDPTRAARAMNTPILDLDR
jgi:ketosteroid isomerase-like protein